jgi:hypothetical protein
MKKFLGSLTLVLILLLILWGAATWWLAQITEKKLQAFSKKNYAISEDISNFDITQYKNISFLSAQAQIKLTTTVPLLDSLLSNTNIITTIQHGPVIVDQSGVSFAASKWQAHLDLDRIDAETRTLLTQLFGNKNPIEAEIVVDFMGNAHYRLVMPAFSQEGVGNLAIDGVEVTGVYALQEHQGSAQLNIGEIHMQDPVLEVIVPSVHADIEIQGFAGSQMLGSSQISAKDIKLKAASGDDIHFDLAANTHSQQKDTVLAGDVKLMLENIEESSDTVKQINYLLNYDGFSIAGLNELTRIETEVNDLQNQLRLNMEATVNPEGQEKMLILIQQMQQVSQQMIEVFFNKVLIATQSQIQQMLTVNSDKQHSNLSSNIVYTGLKTPQDIEQFMLGDINGLLMSIAGTLSLNIDKTLLSGSSLLLLNQVVEQGLLKKSANNFSLDASLTDGNITLNGTTFSFDEFMQQFAAPELASDANDTLDITSKLPSDIAQRMNEEGLTADILQTIEVSEDIDPDVIKQAQELYQSSQQQNPSDSTIQPDTH